MNHKRLKVSRLNTPAVILFLAATSVLAASAAHAKDWEYSAELYALAADVKATSSLGQAVNADFDDILDNLEFAIFGSFSAKQDKLTLFANLFYVDVEAKENKTAGPVSLSAEVGLENFVSTLGAGWAVFDNGGTTLNVLGGVRYLAMDTSIQLTIDPPGVQPQRSESESNWDGVVGVQGRTALADRWYLTYYADVGTGDSDLTWQAIAGINYQFEAVDVVLGYQYLKWEFDGQALDDLEMAGPALGVKFHF